MFAICAAWQDAPLQSKVTVLQAQQRTALHVAEGMAGDHPGVTLARLIRPMEVVADRPGHTLLEAVVGEQA